MDRKDENPVVRVRIGQLADAETITGIINSAFRRVEQFFIDEDRIDVESVRNFLGTGKFLLAESDNRVVGCVYVEARGDRAYLGLLAVEPERQQAGLGSVLMDEAENYCRQLECRFMDIRIVDLRRELPRFYRRRGYIKTGTSPFPPGVDTKLPCQFIEMSKPLEGPAKSESQ